MTDSRSGQCLCGAVRFTAEDVATKFGACHCDMCQRWAGGPFLATSVRKLTIEAEENLERYASSAWAERGFCRVCGSNLFYRVLKSDSHEICIGTFHDRDGIVLTSEIFIDQKPDGFSFAGDHPRLDEAKTLAKYPHWAD